MDKTTPMKAKPLVNVTCKLGAKGCFEDGRCHALGRCENKIETNADRIRAFSDEELAEFLVGLNEHCLAGIGKVDCSSCNGYCEYNCKRMTTNWLQSEVKGSDV